MNRIQVKLLARYGHPVCAQPHSMFAGWYCALPVDNAGNHLKTSWCLCVPVDTDEDPPPHDGAPAVSLFNPEATVNTTNVKTETQPSNQPKKARGYARAQRRLRESAKAGKLQNVSAQREAVTRLNKAA